MDSQQRSTPSASGVAKDLSREHALGRGFHSLEFGELSVDKRDFAYDVQDELVKIMRADRRSSVVGYKIGLTTEKMQAMCGISEPISGQILADVVHGSGEALPTTLGLHVGVEFEIAVLIGRDAPRELRTLEEAISLVDAVAPALELVDDRNADYGALDADSLIADNSWNAGVVLGAFQQDWPDLAELRGEARSGDIVLGRGTGRHVMGHPCETVRWVTGHLARRGQPLRAGSIVITGSMIPTCFPVAGDVLRFRLARLGEVSVSFDR